LVQIKWVDGEGLEFIFRIIDLEKTFPELTKVIIVGESAYWNPKKII